ncbi:hypothetical protein [Rheinheimera sp.]|uniref:hypothetical protein n=1 Tax=Rheinheimera sp. TaxID=1869214 RepID=UPI00273684B9|nr:hypothetical protein [Rheinheimera sp.]MDP2716203.1 hypothetical protein [Rheinheimera sp.]
MLAPRTMLEQNHDHAYLKAVESIQFNESVLTEILRVHESVAKFSENRFIGLRKLIEIFGKTEADPVLVVSLRQLVKPRNKLVHTYCIEHFLAQLNGMSDYELFQKTIYLMELHSKAEGLLTKLLRELRKI